MARFSSDISVAFIDVVNEGELLKETFDIEATPSAVFCKEGLVFYSNNQKEKFL